MLKPPQLGLKTNPPLIQEKPQKTIKKPAPTKEELLKMTVSTYVSDSVICIHVHILLLNVVKVLHL